MENKSQCMTEKQRKPPSPANSSESNDAEFVVTAEMMIDEEDYENTLDEEEEMEDEDDDDELADLQKESEIPIEQLLAMYYKKDNANDVNDEDALDTDKEDRSATGPPGNRESLRAEGVYREDERMMEKTDGQFSPSSSGDGINNVQDDDQIDPFQNQRVTRGIAALNSQYFDDDYSSDEDYQPAPTDDWKKEIQVGEDYQAEVNDGLSPYLIEEKTLDSDDKLLWTPAVISPEKLTSYLDLVYKLSDFGSQQSDRDDEQALFTLLQTRNVDAALQKRKELDRQPPDVSLWSEEECQNFEQGLRVFGKDFRLIQKNKVQTRTVGEIVQFYYLWKKTERHDAFVTQTKLGRRKYTLPGIADMMGRFIEENESLYSSRSGSPTHDNNDHLLNHHDNLYTNRLEPPIKKERLDTDDDLDSQKENVYNTTSNNGPTSHITSNSSPYVQSNRVILPNGISTDDNWRTSNPVTTISLTN